MAKVTNFTLMGEWVNINTQLSIPVGTNILIQNQTSGEIFVQEDTTSPLDQSDGVLLVPVSKGDSFATITFKEGDDLTPVWVFGNGPIAVQRV